MRARIGPQARSRARLCPRLPYSDSAAVSRCPPPRSWRTDTTNVDLGLCNEIHRHPAIRYESGLAKRDQPSSELDCPLVMTSRLRFSGRYRTRIDMRMGGLILAGGRSRRMGRPKESLPIANTTMSCDCPKNRIQKDPNQLPTQP